MRAKNALAWIPRARSSWSVERCMTKKRAESRYSRTTEKNVCDEHLQGANERFLTNGRLDGHLRSGPQSFEKPLVHGFE
jgi:hypothetical protein